MPSSGCLRIWLTLTVAQVMLDTEGIDAYDQVLECKLVMTHGHQGIHGPIKGDVLKLVCLQTGQYSTQIFSLAVLLSSLFVYNQMGGIDEAALDRLSLVTEMTKHIRVKSGDSAGEATSLNLLRCLRAT